MIMNVDKEKFYEEYGVYPVTDDDIPEEDKLKLTKTQIAEMGKQMKAHAAREYLRHTDWYAARLAETGKAIPDDVKSAREQARLDISEVD